MTMREINEHSYYDAEQEQYIFYGYVCFTRDGIKRILKRQPDNLKQGEYAIELVLRVPDHVFMPKLPSTTLYVGHGNITPPKHVQQMEYTDLKSLHQQVEAELSARKMGKEKADE